MDSTNELLLRYNGSHSVSNVDLLHYGVKGMKWGVRKDRNKIRRGLARVRGGKYEEPSDDYTTARNLRKRAKVSGKKSLSNKELQIAIERMRLENQYMDELNKASKNSPTAMVRDAGKNFIKGAINDAVKDLGKSAMNKGLTYTKQNRG